MKKVTNVQREVTLRFLLCMHQLKAKREIKSKKEFAEKVNFTYSHLVRLEKNASTSVSIDSLCLCVKVFKISATYLLTGQGEIFSD